MIIDLLVFVAGITALTYGANKFVEHSSNIAAHFNVKPFIIGATIIAFGTSAPELVVSLAAAIKGTKSLALGNIFGSNIANIGLILGAIAIISPMMVQENILNKDIPIMIIVMALLYFVSLDGLISRVDGAFLFTGIVLLTGYCITSHKTGNNNSKEKGVAGSTNNMGKNVALAIVGLILLVAGAHYMVESAVRIARVLGMSEMFIGITMVAVGTSLPEFAASTAAVIKKKGDMSIGNIVGSNIFNVLLVIGLVSLIRPIPVQKDLLYFEYPVMLGFAVLVYILGKFGRRFSRMNGVFLLILYVIFIVALTLK